MTEHSDYFWKRNFIILDRFLDNFGSHFCTFGEHFGEQNLKLLLEGFLELSGWASAAGAKPLRKPL